ncbi:hypothetical protein ACHAWF_008411 [Thalassiosira exigua]
MWKFDVGFTKMDYEIDVFYGSQVTLLHFHCAPSGVNGPVAVEFWTNEGMDINGLAKRGSITNEDVKPISCAVSGLVVNNLASLYQAMRVGEIYLNVHTVANPAGEVRGQIFTG